ncbi:restriction endonuclease subunit S [Fusobacterium polymorphum]|uniref:restriction endonuclease subunit S n=1 Tax=Fusobacterium nucleatum subsp. polymorphum TaxID=76857 RepID=UPI0030089127
MRKNIQYKKLGDICDFISGGTPSKSKIEYWKDGKIPWIKISDFKKKYIKISDEKITKSGLENSSAKILKKGTILYTIFASVGKVAILDIEATTNQAIVGIDLKENNLLDKDFLYYFLCSIENNIKKQARGVAQNNINISILKNISIPILSMSLQKNIVKTLKKLEDILENFKQKKLLINFLNKSLFTRMFGDIRTNSKNWEIKNLDSIYYIRSSKRIFEKDYKKEGVPFFRSKEIVELSNSKNIIPEIYISFDKYEELKKASGIPLKDDLLITAVGTIGKIWKVNYEKDFYFKDGNLIWLQLKNKNQFNTLSLKRILEDSIKNEKENLASGSAYNALTIDKLKKFNIIMPPIELQNKFAERVEKIEKLSFEIEKSIKEAQNLYNSLMNKYFD